jgi:hypothetical protein
LGNSKDTGPIQSVLGSLLDLTAEELNGLTPPLEISPEEFLELNITDPHQSVESVKDKLTTVDTAVIF